MSETDNSIVWDGSEFMLDQFNQEEIGLITFVPEPATLLLLGIGAVMIRNHELS